MSAATLTTDSLAAHTSSKNHFYALTVEVTAFAVAELKADPDISVDEISRKFSVKNGVAVTTPAKKPRASSAASSRGGKKDLDEFLITKEEAIALVDAKNFTRCLYYFTMGAHANSVCGVELADTSVTGANSAETSVCEVCVKRKRANPLLKDPAADKAKKAAAAVEKKAAAAAEKKKAEKKKAKKAKKAAAEIEDFDDEDSDEEEDVEEEEVAVPEKKTKKVRKPAVEVVVPEKKTKKVRKPAVEEDDAEEVAVPEKKAKKTRKPADEEVEVAVPEKKTRKPSVVPDLVDTEDDSDPPSLIDVVEADKPTKKSRKAAVEEAPSKAKKTRKAPTPPPASDTDSEDDASTTSVTHPNADDGSDDDGASFAVTPRTNGQESVVFDTLTSKENEFYGMVLHFTDPTVRDIYIAREMELDADNDDELPGLAVVVCDKSDTVSSDRKFTLVGFVQNESDFIDLCSEIRNDPWESRVFDAVMDVVSPVDDVENAAFTVQELMFEHKLMSTYQCQGRGNVVAYSIA